MPQKSQLSMSAISSSYPGINPNSPGWDGSALRFEVSSKAVRILLAESLPIVFMLAEFALSAPVCEVPSEYPVTKFLLWSQWIQFFPFAFYQVYVPPGDEYRIELSELRASAAPPPETWAVENKAVWGRCAVIKLLQDRGPAVPQCPQRKTVFTVSKYA
jgi:hypothetical protein